jgi:hypothetical protein
MIRAALLISSMLLVQDAERIANLIRDLDAEEFSVRDDAARELTKIGEPALPALEEALRETKSEEVRGCIPRIAGAIRADLRRRAFKGGEAVNGLSACTTVETLKDGTIVIRTEIMNIGATAAAITAEIHTDFSGPAHSRSSTGSHGRFHIRQLSGPSPTEGSHAMG